MRDIRFTKTVKDNSSYKMHNSLYIHENDMILKPTNSLHIDLQGKNV